MLPARKQHKLPTNGVAEPPTERRRDAAVDSAALSYLPDFAASGNVLVLLVIAQIVALMLALVRDYPGADFWQSLGETSLLVLWLAVSSAWLLALARPRLGGFGAWRSSVIALAIVLGNTTVSSAAVYWIGIQYGDPTLRGPASMFPQDSWIFMSRNLLIATVVTAAILRYFYVMHQWRRNVETAAESMITALQARIRPHFLFNSMNTIAALTRTDPRAAESAVEDLADLFRASLGSTAEPISLEQELEVAHVYERMEQQRLGARLRIDWQLNDVPLQTRVPGLTIQPLLENAIYHGIEPLAEGGVITVTGATEQDMLTISVANPLAPRDQRRREGGHNLALDNIRQRLELAYGGRARMDVKELADHFLVVIGFPLAA
jgi:two-component system sensor histidine kinase AlgZ